MKMAVKLLGMLIVMAMAFGVLQAPAQAADTPTPTIIADETDTGLKGSTTTPLSVTVEYDDAPVGYKGVVTPQMSVDWGWYSATVWYDKAETKRVAAYNAACGIIVGKIGGWVAKVISGGCGIIGVWAGYAATRGRCVGVKVSYFLAQPYDYVTRSC